jgi:hypothetical protein
MCRDLKRPMAPCTSGDGLVVPTQPPFSTSTVSAATPRAALAYVPAAIMLSLSRLARPHARWGLSRSPFPVQQAGSPCELCVGSWQRPCMPGPVPGDTGIKSKHTGMAGRQVESNSIWWSGLTWLSINKIPSPQEKIWLPTCSCLCTGKC